MEFRRKEENLKDDINSEKNQIENEEIRIKRDLLRQKKLWDLYLKEEKFHKYYLEENLKSHEYQKKILSQDIGYF